MLFFIFFFSFCGEKNPSPSENPPLQEGKASNQSSSSKQGEPTQESTFDNSKENHTSSQNQEENTDNSNQTTLSSHSSSTTQKKTNPSSNLEKKEEKTTQEDFLGSSEPPQPFIWKFPCPEVATNRPDCNLQIKRVQFSCEDSYETIKALKGPTDSYTGWFYNNQRPENDPYDKKKVELFIGETQSSQNETSFLRPVIASFVEGKLQWCRDDYDKTTTPLSARPLGIVANDVAIFAAFESGQVESDLTYYSGIYDHWFPTYEGEGRTSLLVDIHWKNGNPLSHTFLPSHLIGAGDKNQKGGFTITGIKLQPDSSWNFYVYGKLSSDTLPLKPNGTPMTCSQHPENYYVQFIDSFFKKPTKTGAKYCQ